MNKIRGQYYPNAGYHFFVKVSKRGILRDVFPNLSFAIPILSGSSVGEKGQSISHVNPIDLPHDIGG